MYDKNFIWCLLYCVGVGWGGSSGYENDNIKVLLILVFSIIFLIFCDVFNLFLCCRY